jgi:putative phosphoribosyl transferase
MFEDRADAGRQLAARLESIVTGPVVVAGIPRGGVVVAAAIAERLRAPLAVAYARKLSAPLAPELAFGAVDEDGESILDPAIVAMLELAPVEIEVVTTRVTGEIRRRMGLYQARAPRAGEAVILVDDGLATGLTMRAALAHARRHGAREVTVAAPCASAAAAALFEREADHFVGLVVDPEFYAVGAYYRDFGAVPDTEVVALLRRARGADPMAGRGCQRPRLTLLTFRSRRGRRLVGTLRMPEGPGPHPAVAVAHGWGSGKDSPRNVELAERLQHAGIAALLFDFTGNGDSDGAVEDCTPSQQADDLEAALDALRAQRGIDPLRLGLVGASSGGAAALRVAATRPDVRAVVLRSANPQGAEAAATDVTAPTLLVVGEEDAPIRAMNEALVERLGGPRRLEIVPGGDHLFGDPAALARAVTMMTGWLQEHLHGLQPEPARW